MRISPSKFQAWAVCPCFERVVTEEDADEGTRLHEAIAEHDTTLLHSEEDQQVYAAMLQYENGVRAELGRDVVVRANVPMTLLDSIRGTLDFAAYSTEAKRGIIVDWKTGRLGLPMLACDCYQLMGYFVGYAPMLPDIDEWSVRLVAPRTLEVTEHTYHQAEVAELLERLRRLVSAVEDPFKKPNPEDVRLCEMCRHKTRCTALCKALEPVESAVTKRPSVMIDLATPVELMDPKGLSDLYSFAGMAEEFFKAKRQDVKKFVLDGNVTIPGYKKVTRGGRLEIASVPDAVCLLRSHGFPELQVMTAMRFDMKALRELCKGELENILDPLLQRGPSVVYLQRSLRGKED